MQNVRAVIPQKLWALAALLLAGGALLGSSAGFSLCGSSDIYNRPYDQTHEFSDRWHRGRGADLSLWTPDGSRILFSHAGGIYVVDADGTELTSLSGSYEPAGAFSETTEIDFSPALSPDGSRAAYATLRYAEGGLHEHTYEIVVQPIDGGERVRLTENDRDDIAPSWSPDGSLIAFMSPKARGEVAYREGYRIFAMSPDGSGERGLAPSVSALCCTLAWSRGGGRLAFIGERRETGPLEWVDTYDSSNHTREVADNYVFRRQSIYTVNPDGSGLVELAWSENPDAPPKTRIGSYELRAPEEGVSAFQWSPDGERLAFVARRYGDKDGVYVADSDGASSVRRVFDLADILDSEADADDSILEIAWSPDGSRIGFEAGRIAWLDRANWHPIAGVYSVSADGSDLRRLVQKDMDDYLRWSDRVRGSGPKRIVRYAEMDRSNVEPELKGWILATAPWGGSDETVLARIVNNRIVAANPPISEVVDPGEECSKAGGNYGGLAKDCRTLLEIRDALAGDAVLYWSGDRPISEWPGVTVKDGRVRALESVPGVQLNGTIPPEIARLRGLRTLNLEDNELVGGIPPELGSLPELEILDIGDWWAGHNRIAGSIPPELGNLSNLRILDLSGNGLEGEIPAELGGLSSLEELRLESNPLQGGIPPELGNLNNLRALYLGGNDSRMNTTIPPELGGLERLEELSLVGASLTGGIPPELGDLSNLRELDLRGGGGGGVGSGLTGPIPSEFANLMNLNKLNLSGNRLEGRIPPELDRLVAGDSRRLGYVDLTNNRLTGCVSPALSGVWSFRSDLPVCE